MIQQDIYLKNGMLFAKSFERVVHGGRGDYVEFSHGQIIPVLYYKFYLDDNDMHIKFDKDNVNMYTGYYYHWLMPSFDYETKVYYQMKTVKYADYKIGYFYVSPSLFLDFKDPDALF